jgi:hypothetical protein
VIVASRTISNIRADAETSWAQAPYLTLDIDWAHDEILAEAIALVEAHRVPATWFVTHDTPLLARLRSNPDFELGIHPNFNFLLNGDGRAGRDAADVLDRLLAIVPEAQCVRSHSTTQSSGLLDLFRRRGLTHECNSFIPVQSGIELKPWRLWSGMTCVPYSWEDDVACLYGPDGDWPMRRLLGLRGIKVFDFHPVHIFLNTEHMDRYEKTRAWHKSPQELLAHRYEGEGTRTRFLEYLRLTSAAHMTSS